MILEKTEETGQLMLNRPYKGLFRYQKELLPFTADSKVNSRWCKRMPCAVRNRCGRQPGGVSCDLWQPRHGRYRLCGSPQHDARYLGRNGRRWTDMDPQRRRSGCGKGRLGQTFRENGDLLVRRPEDERYGTIGMILKDRNAGGLLCRAE